MLILYIAIIAIIVTFGFVLFAVYRNFDPEDKPMAGSLTSGLLAVIVVVIAWYFVQQQITAAQQQARIAQQQANFAQSRPALRQRKCLHVA